MTDARSPRRPWSWVLLLAVAVGAYGGAVTEALLGLLWQLPWNWAEMALRGLGPTIGWGLVYALQNAGLFPTREADSSPGRESRHGGGHRDGDPAAGRRSRPMAAMVGTGEARV